MKHILKAAALAATLAGCNTASTLVSDIQQAAVAICAFEPTAASVASIITATTGSSATATNVSVIAGQICKVVTSMPAAEAKTAAPWLYPGTTAPIHGTFVKQGIQV